MSRVVNFSSAVTLTPVSSGAGTYEFTLNTGTSYVITNAYADSNSTTSARLQVPATYASRKYEAYFYFDSDALSNIPSNATINSVTGKVKYSLSSTNTGRVSTVSVQLYSNTTAKGTAITTMSTAATAYSLTAGTWTYSELQNMRLYVAAQRGTNTSNSAYLYLYGADVTINYTVNGTEYEVSINNQSSDATTDPSTTQYVFQGGSQEVKIYIDDINDIIVKDNNTNVTSSLVYINGGENDSVSQTANSYSTGGTYSTGSNYGQYAVGRTAENPNTQTGNAYASSNNTAYTIYSFDFSSIPSDATIDSVVVTVNGHAESTTVNTSRFSTVQLYANNTAKGSSQNFTATSNYNITITDPGTWTRSELQNAKLRHSVGNYGGLVNGITWTVNYTVPGDPYYKYTVSNISADHTILIEDVGGTFYDVNASSTYTGATVSPSTQSIREGRSATINIDVDNLYEIVVKDNGTVVQVPEPQASATYNFVPSSYVETASTHGGVYNNYNPTNVVGQGTGNTTTYTRVYATTTANSVSKLVYEFDCSSIPRNAVIESVTCGVRGYVSSTQYLPTRYAQLYCGDTAKGSQSTNFTTTSDVQTISDGGTWTRDELDDIRVAMIVQRGTSTTSANFRMYGATLLVTYSVPCSYVINNIQSSHTVTVEEAPYYNITTANTYAGATITAPTKVYVGQSETVTINVANTYEVVVKDNGTDITSQLVGSNGVYRYTISNASTNHAITVEEAQYKTVTTTSNFGSATVSANPTKVYANMSSVVTVSVTGLYMVRIKDNGTDITSSFTGSNGTYRYTIPSVSANHTIVVDEAPYYSITVNNNYNAATASTSPTKIYDGMSGVTTIRVTNADEIVVLDDGVNVSSSLVQTGTGVYTYTITGVNANHTITINQSNRYTLTASSTYTAVTITPATTEVVEGRNATFTLEGEEGVVLTTDITLLDNGVDVTNQIVAAEGETGSTEYFLGTFDEDSSEYVGIYNNYVATNAEGNSAAYAATAATASTRSSFYTNSGEGQTIKIVYNIPAGTVPNGAILTNVKCDAVLSMAYTGQGYSTIIVQLYAGDVAKGEPTTPTKTVTTATTTVNGGSSWTAQELANAKIVISGVRNNTNSDGNTTGQRDNLNIHGATLILEYMYPAGAVYTVQNVQSAHTIVVNEVPAAYYDIIATATYTGATVSPASQSIRNGRNASVNITTDYDYRILVRDNGVNVTNQLVGSDTAFTYHITNVQSAHTVVVESAPTYIVSAVSEYTGATIAPSSQTVYEGQTATVEIEATNINEISVLDNGTDVTEQLVFTEGGPTSSMTVNLGEFDEDSSQYLAIYNNYVATNAEGHTAAEGVGASTSSTTRSAFYAESGVGDTIKIVYNIPFTGLPQGAVITNVSCDAAVSRAYAGSGYSLTTLQLFAGDTAKGDPVEFTTPSSYAITVNVDGGSQWTQSELANAKIVMYGVRNNITNGYNRDNLSFHGADLIVTYGDGTSFNGYVYTTPEIHERHDIVITEIEQFTVNASSTVQGVTITPTSTTVNARTNVTLTISGDISEVEILDNGIEISSQLTEVNATSHTYTIWSITAGHTVVVTAPSNEHDYIKVDDEFQQIKNYYKKINGVWTLISKDAFSGYITTNVSVFGGKYEVRTIGTVTESSTDFINISINDGVLSSGTYTLIYEDANHNPIEHVDKITQFTIN